jgi:hypothetical protein
MTWTSAIENGSAGAGTRTGPAEAPLVPS